MHKLLIGFGENTVDENTQSIFPCLQKYHVFGSRFLLVSWAQASLEVIQNNDWPFIGPLQSGNLVGRLLEAAYTFSAQDDNDNLANSANLDCLESFSLAPMDQLSDSNQSAQP